MLPFTLDDLNKSIADGRVTERQHPTLPLYIYNYSPEVQYTNYWDDVTLNCRGLILDEAGNIVARPWKKFFNLGQVNLPIQMTDPVEVMDKADGSLGIVYPVHDPYFTDNVNEFAVATRGSFASEQAIHATAVLQDRYSHIFPALSQNDPRREVLLNYTFLFEIIYPSNRIVLDYGDTDDLMLLGAVENQTGYYLSPLVAQAMIGWDGPVVEVYEYKSISDALGAMGRKNKEGYVIRSHNFMVKVKEPDYLELHRLVTNASPKTVWEQLKAGKSKTEIVSAFPDEFHDYIGAMIDPLIAAHDARTDEILDGYASVVDSYMSSGVPFDRGAFARSIAKAADKRYYFLLLDNKPISDVLWTELKPTAE